MLKRLIQATFAISLVTFPVAHAETAIKIENAWVRTAPPSAKVMAGYMEITNHSQETISIININSPQFKKVELHRSVMNGGMMHMKKIEPIILKGHQKLVLKPGSYHLMLIKPIHAIAKGEQVRFNFGFNNGDKLSLIAKARDEMAHADDHQH